MSAKVASERRGIHLTLTDWIMVFRGIRQVRVCARHESSKLQPRVVYQSIVPARFRLDAVGKPHASPQSGIAMSWDALLTYTCSRPLKGALICKTRGSRPVRQLQSAAAGSQSTTANA
jgi:hypothetical protein